MGINSIISVAVKLTQLNPALANFGTILLLAYTPVGAGGPLVRSYASPDEALEDGHEENSSVYRALLSIFSQNPTVPSVKVGRRGTSNKQTIHFEPLIFGAPAAGTIYKLTIQSGGVEVPITYTTLVGDTTNTLVATGLKAAIDAESIPGLTTSVASGKLVCVADDGVSFGYVKLSKWLALTDATATTDLLTDLAAVILEDPNFYGLVTDVGSKAGILAVAEVVETQERLYVSDSPDTECADSGEDADVLSSLLAQGYLRTFVHNDTGAGQWVSAGLMAQRFTENPGSDTWALKTLQGLYPTTWNTTELAALDTKRGNYYQTIAGINVTQEGRTPGGYVDVIRGMDWLVARIQERVFAAMLRTPKLPYTDAGVEAIKSEVKAQLEIASLPPFNFVVPGFRVTAPKVADVPGVDKSARVLRNVKFSATLQGAIHSVRVEGELVS